MTMKIMMMKRNNQFADDDKYFNDGDGLLSKWKGERENEDKELNQKRKILSNVL